MAAPLLFRIRLAARTVETSSAALTVGTLSSCAVVLRDPIASEEHCRLSWAQGSFWVEDLGSATGTYLNGLAIEGRCPLHEGDRLVVGVSQLVVERVGTGAAPLLELAVEESTFHYVATGAEGPKRDADNWVRWEVAFGRLPGLRLASAAAALLALGALTLPWLRPAEEAVLSAGELRASHAILFEGDEARVAAYLRERERPADDQRLREARAIAQREGCAACHDAFHGTPMAKCASCHEDKVRTRHPFRPAPYPPSELASGGWSVDDCVGCHAEHKGPGDPHGPERRGEARETCGNCHTQSEQARALERLEARIEAGATGPATELLVRARPSLEFSHREHLAAGMECTTCHQEAAQVPGNQFLDLTFERCMECHAEAATSPHASKELRVSVPTHGTDEDARLCRNCHAEPKRPGLKTAPAAAQALEFEIARRPHGDVFERRATECAECHLDGAAEPAGQTSKRPFQHGVHLAALQPASRAPEDLARASEACLACHAGQEGATGFVADRTQLVPDPDARCGRCHRDDAGQPLEIRYVLKPLPQGVQRTAFAHADHATVAGSCLACHAFEASDEPFQARPVTRAACAECHDASHAKLENGACTACHRAPAPGRVPPAFADVLEQRPWPKVLGFDHFEEGHQGATDSGGCTVCHPGTEQADDLRSVPVLGLSSRVCTGCHCSGAMFHFQLPGD